MATPTVSAASAPGAGAPTPAIFAAPGAAAAGAPVQAGKPPPQAPPQPQLPPVPVPRRLQLQYAGVRQLPGGGGWAAQVLVDPERRVSRTLGPFPDPHAAALAHDRVAIAYLGDSARANFRPGFHPVEQRFLRLCRTKEAEIDVCALVADAATYEARYAAFLRAVLALERWGEYMGVVLDFFIGRAAEIGREALEEGGKKLEERFVEMHRNKAVDPRWRAWYLDKVAQQRQQMEMKRRQQQQQQKRHGEGGSGCASTVQQHQQQQHQHQQSVQPQHHQQQQQQTVQPQQLQFPDVKREN